MNSNPVIRDFRYTDLNAVIDLANISFADEFRLIGLSEEGFAQQVRMMTRLRMIPFKFFAWLSGHHFELPMAEVEGKMVGFGMVSGRKSMNLSTLMVHPDFRRQGIGRALTEERLSRVRAAGFPHVTVSALTTNAASLGNLYKNGFEVYETYTYFEKTIGDDEPIVASPALQIRTIQPSDRAFVAALDQQVTNPTAHRVEPTAVDRLFPSLPTRLLNRTGGALNWQWLFELDGKLLGALSAGAWQQASKLDFDQPLFRDEDAALLPAALDCAINDANYLGMAGARVTLSEDRAALREALLAAGWRPNESLHKLVKWLG
ncbi:MAG: GNAT family N-acetyltransferase [Caldilineales bacterium]|nr:GNAT family N-acetyltransferase [Caldilineales bacterium]